MTIDSARLHPSIDNAIMVLVDVQGRLARLMHHSEAMIRQQRLLIQGLQILKVPIVWAEQVPDKLGGTVDELSEVLGKAQPLHKVSFGCCEDKALSEAIEKSQRTHILLAGIEAHVCVWQTAASLLDRGHQVHVIEDAISSRQAANKAIGLRRMYQAGAVASCVEMVLFELMGRADHPDFRAVSRLIKDATT